MFEHFLSDPSLKLLGQLLLSTFLGGLIGIEREYARKEAGLRTYILISLGATLFTLISLYGFDPELRVDHSRIIGQIVVGIGFLGAGVIIFRQNHLEGLTTAAAMWAAAAIGVAVGMEMYFLASVAAFLVVAILSGLRIVEDKILDTK